MGQKAVVSRFAKELKRLTEAAPDPRAGRPNQSYRVGDGVLGAFGVFFTQSPSFLAYQRDMARRRGRSNAHTLFGLEKIPSDNQIRNLVDPIPADHLDEGYAYLLNNLEKQGALAAYQVLGKRLLMGLDGSQFFSSTGLNCDQCSRRQVGETMLYSHSALIPLLVHPQQAHVLPFIPEFIRPQDGADKQDCELTAAKRWLAKHLAWLAAHHVILLGDDLFSHQPFCQLVEAAKLGFILVCKEESHDLLYEWIEGMARGDKLPTVQERVWNGRHGEIWRYRYALDVPLRAGDEALFVNWCELTISHQLTGERLYHNSWVTNLPLDDQAVKPVARWGRTRWKNENEGYNVLKTKGYHLEHNFGHGQQHLTTTLLSLNLLAFLLHTYLHLVDTTYQKVRTELGRRQTFFEDIRALTRYLLFDSWEELLHFMAVRLELEPPPD